MRVRALIKALGGPTAVAEELGLRVATVGNWSLRDAIAPEHHIAVWRLASARGVAWTPPDGEGLVLAPAPALPAQRVTGRRRAGSRQGNSGCESPPKEAA
jgi:hypothetical protein